MLDVHLEVETGLGRGGFHVADLVAAGRAIEQSAGARLAGLWTHLQAAEDAARTQAQLRCFEEATEALERAGVGLPQRHLAASGGMLIDDVASYDGVRPGLATYGIVPEELVTGSGESGLEGRQSDGRLASGVMDLAARLRPVLELHARPVRVAELPAGSGISYGPTFTTTRPSRIATLPLGYGDGWPRSLSNRAEALVRGRRVPLVGNVAMDAVMADVTDIPGAPVTTADEFVLIGAQGAVRITAVDIARARETNSWEVLTDLSARLPRVYHAASVARETRTLTGHHRAAEAATDVASGRRSMRS
jgi:alanine racemase